VATDFGSIRSWDGSKDRAFEELCYQLRDPTPSGAELIKTGDPDGGLEWYVRHRNGVEWGWQAKYSSNIDTLLKLMEKSLKTVVDKRPNCRRLTFCIPFDLPDAPGGNERKSARQKFEDRKKSWRKRLPGATRVTVELLSAGQLLERLTAHPNERGIAWFFWDQEVFSQEWLNKRLSVTVKLAGERYSPELHVNLPVAFATEGLAGSPLFWARYRERRTAVAAAISDIGRRGHAGIGVTDAMRALHKVAAAWEVEVPDQVLPPSRLPSARLLEVSRQLQDAASSAYPEPPRDRKKKPTDKQAQLDERRKWLRHDLTRLSGTVADFSSFLRAGAAQAAERGALLLTGEAGQGKTHLLCDVGERAISEDRPAIVLLGGQLSGSRFWSDCAERLGLGQVGGEVLLGGMRAAAEASDAAFLLLVDALNESAVPSAWSNELPALIAELDADPWISLGVSVRSTFLPVVLPEEGLGDSVAAVDHPGFQGRELEATERFFDAFGLEQPRVPLLTPEFTNPLFLKLYCEGLKQLGLKAPPAGEAHISDVFARHLEWKSKRIAKTLELDPADRCVERAIERFSEELGSRGTEHLPRDEAAMLVNGFAPHLHKWPRTMVGQLLSEGLLAQDLAWTGDSDEPIEAVRFVYQRFADYRIAGALLDPFDTSAQLQTALRSGQSLRDKIYGAPGGWIEALSVLVPERFGIELLDATNWRFKRHRRERWERALARSVVSRRPESMTDRARELLSAAERKSRYLSEEIFEAVLSVAPIPAHPLNADHLHQVLIRREMADRYASWGVEIFYAFGNEGPIDRLIRWAARGPYPECPDEVLRLAGTLIAWTLTSPNRFMRDYATKAMRQVLASRPQVLEALVTRFAGVDDPYLTERLTIVVHGSLLTDGDSDPDRALRLARHLRDSFLTEEAVPNVLVRDAVRGSFEWALRKGLIDRPEYEAVLPPYGSSPPEKPRTKKQLEKAYDRNRRDRKGNYIPSPYGRLFFSLFDLGDFGRYVAESKLSRFTTLPLSKPGPKPRTPKPSQAKWAAFLGPLTEEKRKASDLEARTKSLTDDELRQMIAVLDPPTPAPAARTSRYPAELGQRWIFERVLSLGWTPERFARFEDTYLREGVGRSGHKAERFGKKYQWVALRELIARVADNFHMTGEWSDDERTYRGPWQFYGRDIDPTLPPALRYRDDEDDAVRTGPTFKPDPPGVWWDPGGPSYLATDPLPPDDWATQTGDIPEFESLVRRVDDDGTKWMVLQAYFNRDEERIGEDRVRERPRRDMWSYIYSWLIPSDELKAFVNYLKKRSFMGRWMPEAGDVTNDAYLAEMPWAEAASEYPREWQSVRPRREEEPGFEVLPAWESYTWEGGGWDCSLEDSINVSLPASVLFDLADLDWAPGTRVWRNRSGTTVAQYVSRQGEHSAVLVRESWLKAALKKGGWGLAIGWLGEKMLFPPGWMSGLIGEWTEMNGVASFGEDGFKVASQTVRQVSQRTDGGG
jgi:hypothetical protein